MIPQRVCGVIGLDDKQKKWIDALRSAGHRLSFLEDAADYARFMLRSSAPRCIIAGIGHCSSDVAALTGLAEAAEPGDLFAAFHGTCSIETLRGCVELSAICARRGVLFAEFGVFESRGLRHRSLAAGGGQEACQRLFDLMGSSAEEGPVSLLQRRIGDAGSAALFAVALEALLAVRVEILAEAYHMFKSMLRISHDEMRPVFADWNAAASEPDHLIAAVVDILGIRDSDGQALLEKVLDMPRWGGGLSEALRLGLETGLPLVITSATEGRKAFAAMKDERVDASALFGEPKPAAQGDRRATIADIGRGFSAASLLAYNETLLLLSRSASALGTAFDGPALSELIGSLGGLSLLVAEVLREKDSERCLLFNARFKTELDRALPSLRKICMRGLEAGIPFPAWSAALSSYDTFRSTWLPENLACAVADRVGEKGYERVDRPRGELHFSNWR